MSKILGSADRLTTWMQENDIRTHELAKLTRSIDPEGVGVSVKALYNMRHPDRFVHGTSIHRAFLIEAVTGGAVSLHDLLDQSWREDVENRADKMGL